VLEDGVVERALDAGLEMAIEVGKLQNGVAGAALEIDVLIENDFTFGKRAGLIGAEDIDAAEILDGGQLLDEDFFARHAPGSLGEGDGDDHGIISGVMPTASATEKRKDSRMGRWKMMLTNRTKSTSSMVTQVRTSRSGARRG